MSARTVPKSATAQRGRRRCAAAPVARPAASRRRSAEEERREHGEDGADGQREAEVDVRGPLDEGLAEDDAHLERDARRRQAQALHDPGHEVAEGLARGALRVGLHVADAEKRAAALTGDPLHRDHAAVELRGPRLRQVADRRAGEPEGDGDEERDPEATLLAAQPGRDLPQ